MRIKLSAEYSTIRATRRWLWVGLPMIDQAHNPLINSLKFKNAQLSELQALDNHVDFPRRYLKYVEFSHPQCHFPNISTESNVT
jgi:hypothetical protein